MKRAIALALALTVASTNIVPVFAAESDIPISLEPDAPVIVEDVSANKKPLDQNSELEEPIENQEPQSEEPKEEIPEVPEVAEFQIHNEEDLRSALTSKSSHVTGILMENISLSEPITVPEDSNGEISIQGNGYTINTKDILDVSSSMLTVLGSAKVMFGNCNFNIEKTFTGPVFNGPLSFVGNTINIYNGGTIFSSESSRQVSQLKIVVLKANTPVVVFDSVDSSIEDLVIQIKGMTNGFTLANQVTNKGSFSQVWYQAVNGTGDLYLIAREFAGTATNIVVHPTTMPLVEKPDIYAVGHMARTGRINSLVFSQQFEGYRNSFRALASSAGRGALINATVLADDLQGLDLRNTAAEYTGFYGSPSFSVDFEKVPVGSEMKVKMDVPLEYAEKLMSGTPDESYNETVTKYRIVRLDNGEGHAMILELLSEDTPAGSFKINSTELVQCVLPKEVQGSVVWEDSTIEVPFSQLVTWSRGTVPVSEATKELINKIENLPSPDKIKPDDEDTVTSCKNEFDSLSEAQKEFFSKELVDKLHECISELKKYQEAKSVADRFIKKMDNLPDSKEELTPAYFEVIKELNSQFITFNEYVNEHIPVAYKAKITELYQSVVKLSSQTIRSDKYDFTMQGMIGLDPKLAVTMPLVEQEDDATSVLARIERATSKRLLSLYRLELSGVKDNQPWSPVTIRFPVESFYNEYSNVGIVEFNKDTGDLRTIQPKIVEENGVHCFEYTSTYAGYLGVVASKKPFSWIYSFFGKREIVSIKYSDLDHSYSTTPSKKNPVMG